jgi:hypothetical protein
MWRPNCFKGSRRLEIERLVDLERHGPLLYQCGYDHVRVFSEVLHAMQGVTGNPGNAVRVMLDDSTGIAGAVLYDRIHVRPESDKLSEKAKQELFTIGIEERARALGRGKLERALSGASFTDEKWIDKIAAARAESMRQDGLSLLAEKITEQIGADGHRHRYALRVNEEIDKRIEALRGEALELVSDKLSSPDYLTALVSMHDRLKAQYEEMRANIEKKFDTDLANAMSNLKEGRLGKAYSILRILGYVPHREIEEGASTVKKNRAPEWLLCEMMKELRVRHDVLSRVEASMWFRIPDRSLAVLVQCNGATYIKEYRLDGPECIKQACIHALNELEYSSLQGEYLPINKPIEYSDGRKEKVKPSPLQRLTEDAMKREHRD